MLEPMILPIASPASFFMMATNETASSGSDVPIATIVIPTIKGEMRNARDKFLANSTSFWVENNRIMIPTTN